MQSEHALVDMIGRTENLERHLEEALVAAGNSQNASKACVASLPYISEGSLGHEDYQNYYGSQRKRDFALALVGPDVSAFGYAFDVEGPFDLAWR